MYNTSANGTLTESPSSAIFVLLTILFGSTFVIGVSGNVLILAAVAKNSDLHSSPYVFLCNMAACDLLLIFTCLPIGFIEFYANCWLLGSFICKLVPYVERVIAHASMLTILFASFERYCAICKPTVSQFRCDWWRAMKLSMAAWPSSILTAIAVVDMVVLRHKLCRIRTEQGWHKMYVLGDTLIFVIIPLVLLSIVFARMGTRLQVEAHAVLIRRDSRAVHSFDHKRQILYVFLAMVIGFFVCVLPDRTATIWETFATEKDRQVIGLQGFQNLNVVTKLLFYAKSALHPVLLNILCQRFRRACYRTILRKSDDRGKAKRRKNLSRTSSAGSASYTVVIDRANSPSLLTLLRPSPNQLNGSSTSLDKRSRSPSPSIIRSGRASPCSVIIAPIPKKAMRDPLARRRSSLKPSDAIFENHKIVIDYRRRSACSEDIAFKQLPSYSKSETSGFQKAATNSDSRQPYKRPSVMACRCSNSSLLAALPKSNGNIPPKSALNKRRWSAIPMGAKESQDMYGFVPTIPKNLQYNT